MHLHKSFKMRIINFLKKLEDSANTYFMKRMKKIKKIKKKNLRIMNKKVFGNLIK